MSLEHSPQRGGADAAPLRPGLIETDRWYRTKEAAAVLHCSPRTLEKLRWYGGGPAFTRAPRVLYRGQWLLDYLEACRVRSTSETPGAK
jgi:hypothetical protein